MNRALKLATMVVEGQDGAWELACRIVKEADARKRWVSVKKAPGRAVERARSLNEMAAHVDLARKVMVRPGFHCELGEHDCGFVGVDPHHLERGTEFEVICELHAIEDEARQARAELSKPRGTT